MSQNQNKHHKHMFTCLFPFPKIIIISFYSNNSKQIFQTHANYYKYFKHFLTYSVIYHSSYCTYIPFAPGFEKGIKPKYIILSASEYLLVYFFIYILHYKVQIIQVALRKLSLSNPITYFSGSSIEIKTRT